MCKTHTRYKTSYMVVKTVSVTSEIMLPEGTVMVNYFDLLHSTGQKIFLSVIPAAGPQGYSDSCSSDFIAALRDREDQRK